MFTLTHCQGYGRGGVSLGLLSLPFLHPSRALGISLSLPGAPAGAASPSLSSLPAVHRLLCCLCYELRFNAFPELSLVSGLEGDTHKLRKASECPVVSQ